MPRNPLDLREGDKGVEVPRNLAHDSVNPSDSQVAKELSMVVRKKNVELLIANPEMDLNIFSLADIGSLAHHT